VLEKTNASADVQLDALATMVQCCLHELSEVGIASWPGVFERYRGRIEFEGRRSPEHPLFRLHILQAFRSEGENALRAAAELARSESVDPRRRMDILLQNGDWFLTTERTQTARKYYREAYGLYAQHRFADIDLARPQQLIYAIPWIELRARGTSADAGPETFAEFEFSVRPDGRLSKPALVLQQASRAQVSGTLISLAGAIYRPALAEGEPIRSEAVRFRQEFSKARE
jgi:hypothetical protein